MGDQYWAGRVESGALSLLFICQKIIENQSVIVDSFEDAWSAVFPLFSVWTRGKSTCGINELTTQVINDDLIN